MHSTVALVSFTKVDSLLQESVQHDILTADVVEGDINFMAVESLENPVSIIA